MDKNKSIDGLVTKRSKKAPVKKTTTKIKAKTTTPKTPKKPKTTTTPPQAPTESNKNTTEDFLAPVQAFNFNEENGKLEATDVNLVKKSKKAKKEKKKPTKKRKIFGIIVIIILLLLIGAVIWFILWGNDIIAKITGGQGNVFDLIFQDETYVDLKTDENGRTNILAIGTSGYNMDGEEGNGTHDGAQLTDSIMVISLNQETGDVAMLSLPRDLKASPTCTSTSKINEIYWCNGGSGDATIEEEAEANTAVMEEVGNILGLDFQGQGADPGSELIDIDLADGLDVGGGVGDTS